jgi:3-hydroxybutyryl-CoA dehydratase
MNTVGAPASLSAPADAIPFALGALVEGQTASVEFSITHEDMRAFADLSGDRNPLHTDDAFARDKGYEGAVVYGALLIAKVSQLIGMKLPGRDSVWANVALEFRNPLYVGQLAQVEGKIVSISIGTGMILLKLSVRAAGKLLAKGTAEVVLVES